MRIALERADHHFDTGLHAGYAAADHGFGTIKQDVNRETAHEDWMCAFD